MRVPGRSAGCPSPSQPRVSRERAVRAVSGAQGPRGQRLGVGTQAACSQAAVCRHLSPIPVHPRARTVLCPPLILLTFIVSLLICPPPPMYLPPRAHTSTCRNAQLWALSLGLTFPKPPAWGGRGKRRQKHRGVLAKLGGPGEPARRPRSPSARLRSPAGRLPQALVWGGWRAERPQGGPAHRPRDLGSPGLLTPAPPPARIRPRPTSPWPRLCSRPRPHPSPATFTRSPVPSPAPLEAPPLSLPHPRSRSALSPAPTGASLRPAKPRPRQAKPHPLPKPRPGRGPLLTRKARPARSPAPPRAAQVPGLTASDPHGVGGASPAGPAGDRPKGCPWSCYTVSHEALQPHQSESSFLSRHKKPVSVSPDHGSKAPQTRQRRTTEI